MKQFNKRILSLLLVLVLVCSILIPTEVHAASRKIITTPTGYDSADDVNYQKTGTTIHNWGARGEDCVFLSTYAVAFYTGKNTYDTLSELSGSKMQNDVPSSELYKALQTLMVSAHKKQTSYGDTRYQYCYTDCVMNDTSMISSFYSGTMFKSTWDQGKTWNREHTWPASKSLSGRPDNGDRGEGADIMMLRPTLASENGSRGNKAFGENTGLGFHDPGVDVRGDCARIVLYTYTRWGNTSNMWGNSGVIESQNILLKWMEEDPVDTWEMGRNDSVQSITGTRNVFVDYPELAYILFGREVPSGMTTPSGEAKSGTSTPSCTHSKTEIRNAEAATCTEDGYTGDTYCKDCGKKIASGTTVTATGHKDSNGDKTCDSCSADLSCKHSKTEVRNAKAATCTEDGYTGDTYCTDCGEKIASGSKITATGHKDSNNNGNCDACSADLSCKHSKTEIRNKKDATCTADGYTGDTYCTDCGAKIASGTKTTATGHKDSNNDGSCDACNANLSCKHSKTETRNKKAATCTADGYTGDTYCKDCGEKIASGTKITATGHKDSNNDGNCDACGASLSCKHENTEVRDAKDATCTEEGYTGDTYCTDCGGKISSGEFTGLSNHDAHVDNAKDATCTQEGYTGDVICKNCHTNILPGEVTPATGRHNYSEWIVDKEATETEDGRKGRICSDCGYAETQVIPKTGSDTADEGDTDSSVLTIIIIAAGTVVLAGAATAAVILIRKKRK